MVRIPVNAFCLFGFKILLRHFQVVIGRFIQNSGLLPKYKLSRSAVSAVMRRRLLIVSAMRFGEIPMAFASWFGDRRYSIRNSPHLSFGAAS
jgi:hypothetical protein